MEKCLLTRTVLVRKLNLKSTRQIMVVIIIDYLLHILIPVEMCSVQIRNAVLCYYILCTWNMPLFCLFYLFPITQTETSSLPDGI